MVYKSLLLLKSNINMTIPHFNLPQRICLLPCVLQLRLKALAATVPHCDLHDESQTPSLTTTSILIFLSNFDSIITVRGQIVNNQNRNSICECVLVNQDLLLKQIYGIGYIEHMKVSPFFFSFFHSLACLMMVVKWKRVQDVLS